MSESKSNIKPPQNNLTHLDASGRAAMVDVSNKPTTQRTAVAEGRVHVGTLVAQAIRADSLKKGNLLQVARLAGIQAAKRTADLILLCHPLAITHVDVQATLEGEYVGLQATVRTTGQTGVEMEALTAVTVAALNVIDMGKALNPQMMIESVKVIEKRGGKSDFGKNTEADSHLRVALLTISDSRSAGTAEDLATPMLVKAVNEFLGMKVDECRLVPDDQKLISKQLRSWIEAKTAPTLILTTGGTGIGPRDVTPEATAEVIERPHPGLLELVRSRCLPGKPHAFLSRAVAGVAGTSLIINLPGSPSGAVDTLRLMSDVLPHALATLQATVSEHPKA